MNRRQRWGARGARAPRKTRARSKKHRQATSGAAAPPKNSRSLPQPTDFVGACSEFFQEEGSRFICAEPSAECRRAFLFSFSSPYVLDHAHFRFLQRADAA